MSFSANLGVRLGLLRTALTRRFVYPDLVRLVTDYGAPYRDVAANLGPFDLLARLGAVSPSTQFAPEVGDSQEFLPPGEPPNFNSEPSVARFLAQLVYQLQPRTVVELGCYVGWTSVHLALALKARGSAGRLCCVDSMPKYLEAARTNLARFGVAEHATFVRGFSLDADVLAQVPAEIDVIFLDTSHNYPDTLHEIETYAPRLSARGCFVLHDSISAPGVRRSLMELRGFDRHTFGTERSNGVTLLVRAR